MNVIETFPRAFPRAYSAASFEGREMLQLDYEAEGDAPAADVTLMAGSGGGGKSQLAVQLLASSALGEPWLNREVKPGPALYVSTEDPEEEVIRRLDRIGLHHGRGFADMARLHIWDLFDVEQPEFADFDEDARRLTFTPLWAEFETMVMDLRPVIAVLDSLTDLFGGDENNRRQVKTFVHGLRRLARASGTAIMPIGHVSLSGGQNGGRGYSGSTQWHNSVRSRLFLSKPEGEERDPTVRLLAHMKFNYGPEQGDTRLHLRNGVFEAEDAAPRTWLGVAAEQHRVDDIFLRLVKTLRRRGPAGEPEPRRHLRAHGFRGGQARGRHPVEGGFGTPWIGCSRRAGSPPGKKVRHPNAVRFWWLWSHENEPLPTPSNALPTPISGVPTPCQRPSNPLPTPFQRGAPPHPPTT